MSKKIEKLTAEQEELIPIVKNEWLDRVFNRETTDIDEDEAIKGIDFIYGLAGYKSPKVLFFDSPMDMQVGAYNLKREEDPYTKVPTYDDIELEQTTSYGSIWDYGWVAFYDYFQRIGIELTPKFNQFKNFLKSGVYDMITLEDYCLVCKMPSIIRREDNAKPDSLHCSNKPAIQWEQSKTSNISEPFKKWYWKGIDVPQKLIETPHLITKEDIQKINDNAEIRRAYIEKLGVRDFFTILSDGEGLTKIDSDVDEQGYDMTLYNFQFGSKELQVLECVCPSTQRVYNLYPPDKCKNVWDAKASTFQNKKLMYRHGDVGLTPKNYKGETLKET